MSRTKGRVGSELRFLFRKNSFADKFINIFRMEHHGIVLILSCGTLHTHASCSVGVFESVFGLMRDPFSDNNWKIKNIKMQLQSTTSAIGMQRLPQLETCDSLQQFMSLPEHEDSL